MSQNIEIHIDRIVLDGFDHMNKTELNDVIQEHLSTLVLEQGLPNGLMNKTYHRKLDGGEMNLQGQAKTRQVGSDIANGIFNGINTNYESNS